MEDVLKILITICLFLCILSKESFALVSPIGFSFTSEGKYGNFPPKDWSVYGLRFNFFGAENKQVVGIDIGGLNITSELFAGMQLGLINYSKKDAYIILSQLGVMNTNEGRTIAVGSQLALLSNYNKGSTDIIGIQLALANIGKSTSIYGWQLGAYNRTEKVVGFQFGIVNYAEKLHGIQIGLLNICKSCLVGVMPGINIGF
jgi:hypothetical protein